MDDLSAVTGLLAAGERQFFGESFIEEADVSNEWSRPGMDFAADTRGVFVDGALVAAVELDQRNNVIVDVLSSHAGRGLGVGLADWAETVARDRGVESVNQFVASPDKAASRLLRARGYVPTYVDWVLRMDEGADLKRHELPRDVSIRGFTLRDGPSAHSVIEEAFADWEGRIPMSYEEWVHQNLKRDGTDPSNFRVATAGEEVVGACVVHDGEGKAWVHQLAVCKDRRGQGIGQELLAETFEAGRHRGMPVGELSTDSRTGALGLYERLGMHTVAQFDNWTKDLR